MMKTLSTAEAARLLHVAVQSVINWVNQGQLKAYRTPGGHRRIQAQDLAEFLRAHEMPVPPELVEQRRRVLVVDDDKAVARWIVRLIQRKRPDIEVFQALDGFAAGEMVGAVRPNVVILDLRMPNLDGFEVCRRIKAKPETADTVVIAITGDPSAEAERDIRAAGAAACLAKPLDGDRLLEEIDRACGPGG